jgi:hypothetical protein
MNIYYVAASETMKAGLLPRILAYVGAITAENLAFGRERCHRKTRSESK